MKKLNRILALLLVVSMLLLSACSSGAGEKGGETTEESTKPQVETVETTKPDGETVPTTPPGEESKPTTAPGEESKPATAPGEESKPATAPGEESKPATAPGEESKPATAPGEESKPATAPGEESKPATAPGEESKPATAPGEESNPATAPGEESKPATAPGEESKPAIAPGEETEDGKTPGSETKPIGTDPEVQINPFPENAFENADKDSVIGSIVQMGDGNAYVNGTVPAPRKKIVAMSYRTAETEARNEHLVTFEHNFGSSCFVSGYMGNSLYVIQDFGSLGWNRKGIGHTDGTVLLEYGENGYFSISALSENRVIVGNPTDESVESLWDETDSYMFGYMIYDEGAKTIVPMYEENNLRFYTAGYFINGAAIVSVKDGDRILFGVIDARGNYIVEPKYEMMADESINNVVIVAENAEYLSSELTMTDDFGRFIWYDSTLMTNVQTARNYNCTSESVGLINTLTGEIILPCSYSYIERVSGSIYFVIDNDGAGFLFDSATADMTPVEEGAYSYLSAEWMLYVNGEGVVYLADGEFNLYEASGFISIFDHHVGRVCSNIEKRINTNVISAVCDERASIICRTEEYDSGIIERYNEENYSYTITVTATGDVIENVNSYTHVYNGGFLFAQGNSLYRYDIESREIEMIRTGYGDYTEDYDGWDATYYTSIYELNTGIYVLRYNIEYNYGGTSYFMVIINDKGEVLFDTAINSIETLCKNYLGRYDDSLVYLAGSTQVEDNYYLTRDDGSHFLIQFVRGESEGGEIEGDDEHDYTRTVDSTSTMSLLSPFILDFADGSEISVKIGDLDIPADCYVYDAEKQSFKLLLNVFSCDDKMHERMREDQLLEITVSAGEETITLRIEVSPFAYRF